MGAGLSGLACAITLEKHGITPKIFESRSQTGDRFINAEAILPVLDRPISDNYTYLSDQFGIFLKPISTIRQINFFSGKNSSQLKGNLGFTNLRGRHSESFENQLFQQVKSPINLNSTYSYETLAKEFTHVILAPGDGAYASKLQNYTTDLTTCLRGVTVEGVFEPTTVSIWLDYQLAPKGYCFLIPYSEHEANLTLAFPDSYPDTCDLNTDLLWEKFYLRTQKDLTQELKITDEFEVAHYMIGRCERPRIANTFFVGNCFGAIMPAFGFGQLASLLTGIYAAYDLCGLGQYEELTKPLRQSYDNSLVLRRLVEKLDDSKLDLLISFMGTNLAHKSLNNEDSNPLETLSTLLRPFLL